MLSMMAVNLLVYKRMNEPPTSSNSTCCIHSVIACRPNQLPTSLHVHVSTSLAVLLAHHSKTMQNAWDPEPVVVHAHEGGPAIDSSSDSKGTMKNKRWDPPSWGLPRPCDPYVILMWSLWFQASGCFYFGKCMIRQNTFLDDLTHRSSDRQFGEGPDPNNTPLTTSHYNSAVIQGTSSFDLCWITRTN